MYINLANVAVSNVFWVHQLGKYEYGYRSGYIGLAKCCCDVRSGHVGVAHVAVALVLGTLAGSLAGWLAGRLADWLARWLAGWFAD